KKRLADRELGLQLSDDAKRLLADDGYDPQFGARPLKRLIQQRIENPLAVRILNGDFTPGQTIEVTVDDARRDFDFKVGEPVVEGELVDV
ncbi:MAG: hypothetical protein AAF743_05725, partial [Planctomycetota bacterium]